MKYVADSVVTDGATSSGPHGISLSTTMDDDVFVDGTLRAEAGGKTQEEEEEASDKSATKLSPGAVRQEVSQAISDKKGTLIIFKQAENKEDEETSKKEGLAESETDGNEEQKRQTSLKAEVKNGDVSQIRGVDSPKKAMASWISEEKVESSEVVSVFTKELKELKTLDEPQQKAEGIQPKSSPTHVTVSASLAVVLYENPKQTALHALPTHSPPPLHRCIGLTEQPSMANNPSGG